VPNLLPGDIWTKVETLFLEAAELSAPARESFVRDRCGGDARIREEVLSLLPYCDEDPPDLLAALGAGAAAVIEEEPAAGLMLGPYRIESEIGRGGMAVVYLAVRADGEFQKRVAIKLIKRGMDTAAVVERLRRERRILASLEHPSIARLLDGGTTQDGRPWIAMEYVEGLPIDRFCSQRNLTIEERCLLIDKVCDAVAYAHRNLVVHRDLKPSNILVAADGNPRLLDFGIAKVLGADEDGGGAEGPLTRAQRPLTPEYASPEQMRGGAVVTATDVYSLGVVLYELLAGRRPGQDSDKNAPVNASAAALSAGRGPRWSKRLEGDLDNILQMSLRAEPERRYPTVEQMQADLRRHLTGRPVSARKETWLYRWGKFFRRHPVGTPAAALIALAAVAGVVFITRAESDAQAQRRKAEQRLGQLVELANHALFDVHDSIERLPGATAARINIVRTTIAYLDKLNAESGNDAGVLSALASAYARVARVQGSPLQPNLGDLRGAEESYVKAGRILDAMLARGSGHSDLQFRDAELRLEYGGLLVEIGRQDDAVAQYQRGIERVRMVLARDPRNLPARKLNSRLHIEIGQVRRYTDPAAALRDDLELLPQDEALVREYPRDTGCLLNLAALWSQIGSIFDSERRLAEAANAFRRSAALRERQFAMSPQDVSVQHDLLMAYGHLGDLTGSPLVLNLGDYRGAVVWYRKAASIAQRMAAADPSNAQARNDEGTALMRIGVTQTAAGENHAALETLKRAETLLVPLRAASPASVPLADRLAVLYLYEGRALEALGEHTAAIAVLRRSIAICDAAINPHPSVSCQHFVWIDRGLLAAALAEVGDTAGALRECQSALDSVRRTENQRDPTVRVYLARALAANGAVYVVLAKRASGAERTSAWRMAADYYRPAVGEFRALHPESEPYLGYTRQAEAGLAESERALKASRLADLKARNP
jgi:tetratricopeptide (TPR) repeat protein/tRNA A-37 threonylcarbamoyl transferase component Bud32